jgi:ACS family hexuronate transporter-like MFS transporter
MSQDINNTIATSKTRRVIKNLRWYVLVLFLLGVTVNYITRNSLGILAPELKRASGSPPSNTPGSSARSRSPIPFSSPCAAG